MENNLPQAELEMALVALLSALREYNNALQIAGREAAETVKLTTLLIPMLEHELTGEPDRSAADFPKAEEHEDEV